jgi:hypothetical protein
VLCQERKEFDCIRVIMVGKTLRALRSLVGWQVVLQSMALTGAQ